jgi:hypothetical protein
VNGLPGQAGFQGAKGERGIFIIIILKIDTEVLL